MPATIQSIYIVSLSTGEYDMHRTKSVAAFSSLAGATAFCKALNAKLESIRVHCEGDYKPSQAAPELVEAFEKEFNFSIEHTGACAFFNSTPIPFLG